MPALVCSLLHERPQKAATRSSIRNDPHHSRAPAELLGQALRESSCQRARTSVLWAEVREGSQPTTGALEGPRQGFGAMPATRRRVADQARATEHRRPTRCSGDLDAASTRCCLPLRRAPPGLPRGLANDQGGWRRGQREARSPALARGGAGRAEARRQRDEARPGAPMSAHAPSSANMTSGSWRRGRCNERAEGGSPPKRSRGNHRVIRTIAARRRREDLSAIEVR